MDKKTLKRVITQYAIACRAVNGNSIAASFVKVEKALDEFEQEILAQVPTVDSSDARPVLTGSPSGTRNYHIGESDYSEHPIQPWDVWINFALNPWDGDIVKRILREKVLEGKTPEESRIQDYEKITHIANERIEQIKNGDLWYANLKKKLLGK